MNYSRMIKMFLAVLACAALLAVPRLPGTGMLGLGGPAAAQQAIDVDYFYDQLDPYGQWVWHPRFGYVWLPNVRESWRPYTVGHWEYTDEYGWYWDSYEPFAWAVYHYGRWGYDPDYGWFWVPGDTWAPAWVQWRYCDNYTGWAPIGPGDGGYAYGAPVNYDPPVAESWVFVQPRYMTSRTIYHYALPVADLNIAFLGATNVYRPVYRTGVVFNFGVPRERVVTVVRRPIVVKKIVKVTNITNKTVIYKNGKRVGGGGGIQVFAPNLEKGKKPHKQPKHFAQSPNEFKAKAKLKTTLKGDAPKGLGPSAAKVTPIAREVGPEGFKPKNGGIGDSETDSGKAVRAKEKQDDKDNKKLEAKGDDKGPGKPGGRDNDKETVKGDGKPGGQNNEKEVSKGDDKGNGPGKPGGQGGGGDDRAGHGGKDKDNGKGQANAGGKQDDDGKPKGKPGGQGASGGQDGTGGAALQGGAQGSVGGAGPDSPDQGKVVRHQDDDDQSGNGSGGGGGQGKKDKDNKVGAREQGGPGNDNGPGGKGKKKGAGGPGGQGEGGDDKGQGGKGQGDKGQGDKGKGDKDGQAQGGLTKAEKCRKNPDAPACKNIQ